MPGLRIALLCLTLLSACKEDKPRVVFKDAHGRELTTKDLQGVTGSVRWEVVGAGSVSPAAKELHEQGRAAGIAGQHERALELFAQAQKLAPDWPYPVYDAAYEHLLKGEATEALALYERVAALAPRGFFTSISELGCLRREVAGELPGGFCIGFTATEFIDDRSKKRHALEEIVAKFPHFAPAWMALAGLLTDDAQRAAAIEQGLASTPDPETAGTLRINRALLQNVRGDREAAIQSLGKLALDPESTLATEMMAKATLASLLGK